MIPVSRFTFHFEEAMDRLDCHVLIVGGGGAALRAAIAAYDQLGDGKIILATKGALGRSGVTATACSDRMAFHATLSHTEPGGKDAWKYHADDIYRIGGYVSDADLAGIIAKGAREAFEYLDALEVPFVKGKDGLADQFVTDGSKYARACYTGPRTANHIEEALVRKIRTLDVEIMEHLAIVRLITSDEGDRVVGAVGLPESGDGGPILFRTKAVVLGTGGAGNTYEVSVFPAGASGDGYAMAYRAGAELVNMEFIQIGLCSTKTKLACSGSIMRAIPRFVDEDNREFLGDYLQGRRPSEIYDIVFDKGASWPAMYGEASVSIDVAVFKHRRAGHSIWLDFSRNPERLDPDWLEGKVRAYDETKGIHMEDELVAPTPLGRLMRINPDSVIWLKEHGVDLQHGERLEIAPAIQHFQGGVKIGPKGETSLKGLYAAGEVAGGQHGAKRPGGNSLIDCQVFGKISGTSAAEEAMDMEQFPPGRIRVGDPHLPEGQVRDALHKIDCIAKSGSGRTASHVRRKIQEILSTCASVVRTEEGLGEGLRALEDLCALRLRADRRGLAFALETEGMFDIARMVIEAARIRQESRGCHLFFRNYTDPEPAEQNDRDGRKYTVVRRERDEMKLEMSPPVHIDWLKR